MGYEYVFRGGQILDGSGSPAWIGDVAVSGGRIMEAAPKITAGAEREIDSRGLLLCPGFIDVHSHSDISLLYERNPDSKIFQGITTEIVGNCGFSPFPLLRDPLWLKRRRTSLQFIDVDGMEWDWETFDGYREHFGAEKPNVNLAFLTGFGSLRAAVMGYENRSASAAELKAMCGMLEEHFQKGSAGLSVGLGYPPDFYAGEAELTELARVVKRYDRIFAFHIRGERKTQFQATSEVISIGRNSGAKVHISHLKCAGNHNRGRSGQLLEMIRDAKCDISFDMYPYTAGSSNLGLVFPPEVHEGGTEALLGRLADPEMRKQIQEMMEHGSGQWSTLIGEQDGRNLRMTRLAKHPDCIGMSLWEIGQKWGCTPCEAACRLMEAERGEAEMVMFMETEEDMDRIAMYPGCLYGTDGLAMGGERPLIRQMPHPRYYGSFPTLIGRYGRTGRIPMERLVSQLSGQAAVRFGLAGRGFIRRGYAADLVLLNPAEVGAGATYENPCRRSKGVEYLMVNGCLEIAGGEKTGACGGNLLSF